MNLIFFRHGEATDNVNGIISDKEIYWSTLTEGGIKSVKETVEALKEKIDKMYVSPFPRTIETANLIYQKYSNIEVVVDNRIREIFYGKYSGGKNNEDLDNTRLKQINGDYFVRFGDFGENKFEIEMRLSLFLNEIFDKNSKNSVVLIVSHGSVISYMKRLLGVKSSHIKTGKAEIFKNVDATILKENLKELQTIQKMHKIS